MKKENQYATNKAGVIKAAHPVKNEPKATVTRGNDLRNGPEKQKAQP